MSLVNSSEFHLLSHSERNNVTQISGMEKYMLLFLGVWVLLLNLLCKKHAFTFTLSTPHYQYRWSAERVASSSYTHHGGWKGERGRETETELSSLLTFRNNSAWFMWVYVRGLRWDKWSCWAQCRATEGWVDFETSKGHTTTHTDKHALTQIRIYLLIQIR